MSRTNQNRPSTQSYKNDIMANNLEMLQFATPLWRWVVQPLSIQSFLTHPYTRLQSACFAVSSGGSRKFWWGGFEAKTSKIRMSSPKLILIFRPKSEIQTFFFRPKSGGLQKKKKKKKKKKKSSSPKLRLIFWPKSEIQTFFFAQNQVVSKKKKKKKKKKALHQNWDWFFGRIRYV